MVKRVLSVLALSFISGVMLFGEVDLDASLSGLLSSNIDNNNNVTSSGFAKGTLDIKSKGGKNVKSQLSLDFISMRSVGSLSIAKAWIKFRYPLFRVTLGKNRVTWGEGAAFNAGDVIFDDYIAPEDTSSDDLDLTADELKYKNRTMALITFPLGRFTFAEGIYLPYDFLSKTDFVAISKGGAPEEKNFDEHSYGGRIVTKALGIKLESGYIYNGTDKIHKPYISLNGTLLVDYQLSSSINIKTDETDFDQWKESFKISTGLFYLFDLSNDKTLTLRLEAMINPYKNWDADALQLYPEIAFIPNDELSLFARDIINPLDFNAETTLGLNWKTYQGFSIGMFIMGSIGDSEITDRSMTVSVTHKF